ncbi:MAG TPA: type II secretion system protein [Chthonomonadaceae bacterium]|nr:type II secretion system protein [Chthonomonadaceae bacterium]
MKPHRMGSRQGFSLVELLAVVLILAVLAAVAVPLYMNTRKTAAARACKANINAIASAEAAYALRNGVYTNLATLIGGTPEGLSASVTCPLVTSSDTSGAYQITTGSATGTAVTSAGTTAQVWISCLHATDHSAVLSGSQTSDWQRTMPAIQTDSLP